MTNGNRKLTRDFMARVLGAWNAANTFTNAFEVIDPDTGKAVSYASMSAALDALMMHAIFEGTATALFWGAPFTVDHELNIIPDDEEADDKVDEEADDETFGGFNDFNDGFDDEEFLDPEYEAELAEDHEPAFVPRIEITIWADKGHMRTCVVPFVDDAISFLEDNLK